MPEWLTKRTAEKTLVEAIAAAERGNRGEVRLHVERRCGGDALERARELFAQLGMERTEDDTGVLLYVAIEDRKTAVFAGAGIYRAAPDDCWSGVTTAVSQGFAKGRPVEGLQRGLQRIGEVLREHLAGDQRGDELPNQVTTS